MEKIRIEVGVFAWETDAEARTRVARSAREIVGHRGDVLGLLPGADPPIEIASPEHAAELYGSATGEAVRAIAARDAGPVIFVRVPITAPPSPSRS